MKKSLLLWNLWSENQEKNFKNHKNQKELINLEITVILKLKIKWFKVKWKILFKIQ